MTVPESSRIRFANRDEMFGATSRAFLATVPAHPDLALDLGCAIGYTTRMLAEALRPARTVGLDRVEAFVDAARQDAPAGVEFLVHDATDVPFPTGAADVVYARFVLPHVEEPLAVLERWAGQLRPGGRLVLEEVEAIRGDEGDDSAIGRYLEIGAALERHHGVAATEVGPLLASAGAGGLRPVCNRTVELRPPAGVVVAALLLNLRGWRRDPFVRETYPEPTLERLHADLRAQAARGGPAPITWEVRQLSLEAV